MHVVVTGAAGHLARVLLPHLCAVPEVDRVTGIDVRKAAFDHVKFHGAVADIAAPRALHVVSQCDAVIHLAFVLLRGRRSPQAMARTNVDATQALLAAAAAGVVRRQIFLSSAAVYGAGVDVTEDAECTPLADFLYARHKFTCERWLTTQGIPAVILRPHIILGPEAVPLLRQLAATPVLPRLPDPQPQLQCVHEQDVAAAIIAALMCRAAGPFNLAAPAPFSLAEMVRATRPGAITLPLPWLRAALTAAWRVSGWGGEPAWLDGVTRTLTLDCTRAREQLGWQPRYADWRAIIASTFAAR